MTPSIHPQPARSTDLGPLGLPPDLFPSSLFGEDDPASVRPTDAPSPAVGASEGLRFTLAEDGEDLPDPLTLAREVRAGLEEALALLVAALPTGHRAPTAHPAQLAD